MVLSSSELLANPHNLTTATNMVLLRSRFRATAYSSWQPEKGRDGISFLLTTLLLWRHDPVDMPSVASLTDDIKDVAVSHGRLTVTINDGRASLSLTLNRQTTTYWRRYGLLPCANDNWGWRWRWYWRCCCSADGMWWFPTAGSRWLSRTMGAHHYQAWQWAIHRQFQVRFDWYQLLCHLHSRAVASLRVVFNDTIKTAKKTCWFVEKKSYEFGREGCFEVIEW